MNFDNFWIEKYRPKTLGDIILNDDTRKILDAYASKKEIPNLLLVGCLLYTSDAADD